MLRQVRRVCAGAGTVYSITTAEQASFIDPAHEQTLTNDVDAAIWEEMETGLHHHLGSANEWSRSGVYCRCWPDTAYSLGLPPSPLSFF